MIGPRVGVKCGVMGGARVGVGTDEIASQGLPGVTQDSISKIYYPSSASQWATVLAAAGIPSGGPFRASDFTVASGNLTDLISSVPLVPSGTGAVYRTAVTGHARTGVGTPDAATAKFATADASLPDLSTTSMLTLTYVKIITAPGTFRNLTSMGLAAGTRMKGAVKNLGLIDVFEGNTNNTTGAQSPVGALHPLVHQHNRATTAGLFASDQESFAITFDNTVAGKGLEVVGGSNLAPNAVTTYEASFKGAAAELTLAQIKRLLTVLGWKMSY